MIADVLRVEHQNRGLELKTAAPEC